MADNEYGYPICKNGGITRGTTTSGGKHNVSIPLSCPSGSKVIGVHHLHPGGSLKLSEQDKQTARAKGLEFICVRGGKKVKCFRFRKSHK